MKQSLAKMRAQLELLEAFAEKYDVPHDCVVHSIDEWSQPGVSYIEQPPKTTTTDVLRDVFRVFGAEFYPTAPVNGWEGIEGKFAGVRVVVSKVKRATKAVEPVNIGELVPAQ